MPRVDVGASASASASSGERAVGGSSGHDDHAQQADDVQETECSEDAGRSTPMDVADPERVDVADGSDEVPMTDTTHPAEGGKRA